MPTPETLSALDQPSKGNVKHVRTVNMPTPKFYQAQINPASKMSSTYKLWTCQHQNSIRLRSTQQRKCQVRMSCEHTNTWDSVSNPARKMSSTYELRTHKYMRLGQQPSKENVKHVQAVNTNTWDSVSNPARKMLSMYLLGTCQHIRLGQPQINPARKI
jgi:hypothetical protein